MTLPGPPGVPGQPGPPAPPAPLSDPRVFAAYAAVVAGLVVLLSVSPSTGASPTLAGGTIFALMGFAGLHALVGLSG